MDSLRCAHAVKPAVDLLGSKFMLAPETFRRGGELGYQPGFAYYMGGRFGVLGRVHADVVVAAAAFISPAVIAHVWGEVLATADPQATAAHYYGVCADWGRVHLADAPALDELCALAAAVVDQASPVAAPVVAGLRALPRADDVAGRAAQLCFNLRELRFARHVCAVVANGVPPLQAVLAGPGGEPNATMFGWKPPFPDPAPWVPQRAVAEGATDARSADDLSVLDDAGRARLAELLEAAAAAATAKLAQA